MANDAYDLEVLQAINDWQRGGNHQQKVRRGRRLKEIAARLPARFQTFESACYRQEAHEPDRLFQLIADNAIEETIASWTVDIEVAKTLKGGVPPPGLQGVIFKILPKPSQVLLSLTSLYSDREFLAALERHRSNIQGYEKGVGRWTDSQKEVVLDLDTLTDAEIERFGGFPSPPEQLVALHHGRPPTAADIEELHRLRREKGVEIDQWWLSPERSKIVLARVEPKVAKLRASKSCQP